MAAASATGLTGDIEVDLARGVVTFHMGSDSGAALPAPADETSADLRKLL
jgi:hypothetical protein